MDPNENLKQQLRLAGKIIQASDLEEDLDELDCVALAELVVSLDGWLRRGGFLPERWEKEVDR